MDRSVLEAMSPVTDQRSSSSSPLSFAEDSVDIWAGLDLDHLHRFTHDEAKRDPPSKKRGTRTCIAARHAGQVAGPVPAARALVFGDAAKRTPALQFFI
jgi:hypothetical protein